VRHPGVLRQGVVGKSRAAMQLPSPHAAFKGEIMNIKSLVGAGDQIMAATLPFALAGIILNVLYLE